MEKLNILLFDLETTPNSGLYWGENWQTSIIEPIEYGKILSYSAEWLGEGKAVTHGWIDSKNFKKGELFIVKELWNLLDKADVVCAHNGKQFDIKKCNARFSFYGMKPPSPYRVVDTLTEAKKYISLPSYRLNDIAKYFGIGRKVEHEGFPLWKKCIDGDKKAWVRMKSYNRMDVVLLKAVYLKMLPWMKSHPNAGIYANRVACPKCGSGKIQSRGTYITQTMRYHKAQCQSCYGWLRFTKNLQVVKPAVSI